MHVTSITPRVQGKILVKQLVKLAKEQQLPINTLTKTEKALNRELKAPIFNLKSLNALREKTMNLAEEIMLGLKK